MMPTFPSSSLKFRTAGCPRYGFKASWSGRACPNRVVVKPAPGIPTTVTGLQRPFARLRHGPVGRAQSPDLAVLPRTAVREAPASLPQGPLAPVRVVLSRSIVAYSDPIRQSRRHAAISRPRRLYAAPSLCGSAEATHETFPTFAAVLSTRAVDPTPVGPLRPPVVLVRKDARLPRIISESPPTSSGSASNPRRSSPFRRCIVRFMLRPVCLPGPPDWLRRGEVTCSSHRLLRYRVIPAFSAARRRAPLGIRLDGRTGNLPSSGLHPTSHSS